MENWEKLTNELLDRITKQIVVEYDNCLYEYIPIGSCYQDQNGKCIVDADLKIERPARQPYGQACPNTNRTQIDCQHLDGCPTAGADGNTISPLTAHAEKAIRSEDQQSAAAVLPFWAVILMACIGGLILLVIIVSIIVLRTPRWRAIFTPSKPRKKSVAWKYG